MSVDGTSNKGTPQLGYLHDNVSLPFIVFLGAGDLLRHFLDKEVVKALLGINVLGRVVGVLEGILHNLPHHIRVLLSIFDSEKFTIFVEHAGSQVPATDRSICLLGQVEHGVVLGAVDPVGSNVGKASVGEHLLVQAASNTVAGLNDCDPEPMLQEDVCASEPSESSSDHSNVRF